MGDATLILEDIDRLRDELNDVLLPEGNAGATSSVDANAKPLQLLAEADRQLLAALELAKKQRADRAAGSAKRRDEVVDSHARTAEQLGRLARSASSELLNKGTSAGTTKKTRLAGTSGAPAGTRQGLADVVRVVEKPKRPERKPSREQSSVRGSWLDEQNRDQERVVESFLNCTSKSEKSKNKLFPRGTTAPGMVVERRSSTSGTRTPGTAWTPACSSRPRGPPRRAHSAGGAAFRRPRGVGFFAESHFLSPSRRKCHLQELVLRNNSMIREITERKGVISPCRIGKKFAKLLHSEPPPGNFPGISSGGEAPRCASVWRGPLPERSPIDSLTSTRPRTTPDDDFFATGSTGGPQSSPQATIPSFSPVPRAFLPLPFPNNSKLPAAPLPASAGPRGPVHQHHLAHHIHKNTPLVPSAPTVFVLPPPTLITPAPLVPPSAGPPVGTRTFVLPPPQLQQEAVDEERIVDDFLIAASPRRPPGGSFDLVEGARLPPPPASVLRTSPRRLAVKPAFVLSPSNTRRTMSAVPSQVEIPDELWEAYDAVAGVPDGHVVCPGSSADLGTDGLDRSETMPIGREAVAVSGAGGVKLKETMVSSAPVVVDSATAEPQIVVSDHGAQWSSSSSSAVPVQRSKTTESPQETKNSPGAPMRLPSGLPTRLRSPPRRNPATKIPAGEEDPPPAELHRQRILRKAPVGVLPPPQKGSRSHAGSSRPPASENTNTTNLQPHDPRPHDEDPPSMPASATEAAGPPTDGARLSAEDERARAGARSSSKPTREQMQHLALRLEQLDHNNLLLHKSQQQMLIDLQHSVLTTMVAEAKEHRAALSARESPTVEDGVQTDDLGQLLERNFPVTTLL